jgi:hypothetical protein
MPAHARTHERDTSRCSLIQFFHVMRVYKKRDPSTDTVYEECAALSPSKSKASVCM